MTQRYLALRANEREALRDFVAKMATERDTIIEDVLVELRDAEELVGLIEGRDIEDRLAVAVAEYLDALGQEPDGAYLERRIERVREGASNDIPFSSLIVAYMALERVLLTWNRRLRTDDASMDAIRDALLRLNDIHLSATTSAYLEGKEETIRAQQEAMLALSVPVVEIWEGILALPLVGTVDTDRARRITQNLLHALRETQARVVIIDISGVPLVDTSVANHLIKTVAAAQLLGAQGIIVGISPEIASTLVSLDIDFEGIDTYYSLRQGLQAALARSDIRGTLGGACCAGQCAPPPSASATSYSKDPQ